MRKRTLAEAKEARRKRWKAIEAGKVPGELSVYGFGSLAASTASAIMYLIAPLPVVAVTFSASFIVFVATCIATIKLRP